jgi:hypothetical protein
MDSAYFLEFDIKQSILVVRNKKPVKNKMCDKVVNSIYQGPSWKFRLVPVFYKIQVFNIMFTKACY